MAVNDVYLSSVPSDSNPADVRLAGNILGGASALKVAVTQTATGALAIQATASQSIVIGQSAAGTLALQGAESVNVAIMQSASGALAIQAHASQAVPVGQAASGALAGSSGGGGEPGTAFQPDAFQVNAFQIFVNSDAAARAVGGGGRKRRHTFTDVIWKDDPRHPQHPDYRDPTAPVDQPEPVISFEPITSVAVDASRVRPMPVPVEPKRARPFTDDDCALALLLLAA